MVGSVGHTFSRKKVGCRKHSLSGLEFVRDEELPGFARRVTKGRKSFILEKRIREGHSGRN